MATGTITDKINNERMRADRPYITVSPGHIF